MNVRTEAIEMPDLGDVSEAVLVSWLRPVGSELQEGDDLLEVETEKTTFVIPAPASGTLAKVLIQEGEPVSPGVPLGEIECAG